MHPARLVVARNPSAIQVSDGRLFAVTLKQGQTVVRNHLSNEIEAAKVRRAQNILIKDACGQGFLKDFEKKFFELSFNLIDSKALSQRHKRRQLRVGKVVFVIGAYIATDVCIVRHSNS